MPNTKSAKKAMRSSEKKRDFNLIRKYKIKNSLKELRKAISNNSQDLQQNLSRVFSSIDKAVKGNLLHKNTAARKKSRVVAMIKKTMEK
jgi:small subunit ribosomal protein S20